MVKIGARALFTCSSKEPYSGVDCTALHCRVHCFRNITCDVWFLVPVSSGRKIIVMLAFIVANILMIEITKLRNMYNKNDLSSNTREKPVLTHTRP